MNNYIGKICPYCKTVFIESDDIVACNKCEMPHHKDCWIENEGCTTFGCLGTIESPDNQNRASIYSQQINMSNDNNMTAEIEYVSDTESVKNRTPQNKNVVYCTRCGNPGIDDDFFCGRCGNSMKLNIQNNTNTAYENEIKKNDEYTYNTQQNNSFNINNSAEDAYINSNVPYFKKKFYALRMYNTKVSWNWPAFFFTAYWLIYRKMYSLGAGILITQFILMIIQLFLPLAFLFTLGISFAFGFLGNYLYMQHIDKLVIEGYNLSERSKSQHIFKNGGINSNATIFTIVGYILLNLLIAPTINSFNPYDYSYCQAEGCYEEAEYGDYCIDHVCLAEGCTNQRISGSQYCYTHSSTSSEINSDYCDVPGCYNIAVIGGNYCFLHTCMANNCYNRRIGEYYCYLHE